MHRMTPPPRALKKTCFVQKKLVGIRGMTGSNHFLILMIISSRTFLKSASGTNKFISILNRTSMKLHSKLSDFLRT